MGRKVARCDPAAKRAGYRLVTFGTSIPPHAVPGATEASLTVLEPGA